MSYFGNDALGSPHFVGRLAALASVSKLEDAKRLLQRYRCARREGRAVVRISSRHSRWTATDVAQAVDECQKARTLQQSASSSDLEGSGDAPGFAHNAERAVCKAVKLLEVSTTTTCATTTPSFERLRQLSRVAQSSSPPSDVDTREVQRPKDLDCSRLERHVVGRRKRRGFKGASSKAVQSLRPGYWLHEDAILEVLQCVQTQAQEVCLVAPGYFTLGESNNVKDRKLNQLNREMHRLVIFPINVDGNH